MDVVTRLLPGKSDSVRLLTDFIDPDEGLQGDDVPDPIGMGAAAYREVAQVIKLALPGLIKTLESSS